MALRTRWIAGLVGLAVVVGIGVAARSVEPRGETRRLVQEVCLAYDDLRFRDGVQLEPDPAIQAMHRRATAACDLVDDGRASWRQR